MFTILPVLVSPIFLKGVQDSLEVELRQVVLSPIQSHDQTTSYQMEAIFLRCYIYNCFVQKFKMFLADEIYRIILDV